MNTDVNDDDETSDLDPRVRQYFDDMLARGTRAASPEYQSQLAGSRTADADASIGRAQLAGISEGLSKLGTLHGKSPDVKPLTTTLGGIDQAQRQRAAGMGADEDDAQKRLGMNAKVYEYLQSRSDKTSENELGRQARSDMAAQAQAAAAQRAQEHNETMSGIAAAKNNTILVNTGARNDAKSDANDAKLDKETRARVVEFGNKMNPSLGRSGELGKTQARINAADRVNSLAIDPGTGKVIDKNTGQPRDLTSGEMTELSSAVAAMVSNGGVASQHVIDSMTPHSVVGDVNAKLAYLFNQPRGSGMQEFVRRLAETAKRERDTSTATKQQAQQEIVATYGDLRDAAPDQWKRILKKHKFDPDKFDDDFEYADTRPPAPTLAPRPSSTPDGTAMAAPAAPPPARDGDIKKTPDGRMFTRVGGQWIEHPAAGAP